MRSEGRVALQQEAYCIYILFGVQELCGAPRVSIGLGRCNFQRLYCVICLCCVESFVALIRVLLRMDVL